MATGLDLRAISIVEGVRAGLAAAVPVVASEWLNQPVLSLAALGALLTCICDPSGPMRRRLPLLLAFVVTGGVLLGLFQWLRSFGMAPVVIVAAPTLFACAYVRVWGQPLQALGNLLAVVLLLGTDDPLSLRVAAMDGAVFMGGGLWALVLTLVIWRIYPYGPARRAVADVWAALATLTRDVARLCESDAPSEAWEHAARADRGAVREAIERARGTVMDTVASRGPASGPAAQNLLRLEAADQVFAALIGLTDVLEPSAGRAGQVPMLRRLRALLTVMARATERERLDRPDRFARTLENIAGEESLRPFGGIIADRLLVAAKYVDPAQYLPGSGVQGEAGVPLRERFSGPLQANLTWKSASLRHAARIAAVVTPTLAATLVWHGPYTHWVTITLVLVMQPFFATTWQRSLERVAGTLLGGVIAGGLSALMRSRLHVAGLLPVLGAFALAVRQVSYAVYIAVYTPTVILLVENIHPGGAAWRIALARAGFTVAGGLLAVAANILLWPTWEPDQVRADLEAAVAAHAAYAAAVLNPAPGVAPEAARRAAGLASNNLEASLARAMQEPRRGQRDRLNAALVADATLRRIAGRLVAISLTGPTRSGPLGQWVVEALQAVAGKRALPARRAGAGHEMLERLARQVAVLPEILARLEGGGGDGGMGERNVTYQHHQQR
jgi:uncharacterized membrane protein YgaE (UPF0421/DUF939 family)